MDKASVFRTEETLQVGPRHHRGAEGALRARPHRRQGLEVFNFDLTEALELGYLIDLAEASSSAPWPAPRAGAATSATTTRRATTPTG